MRILRKNALKNKIQHYKVFLMEKWDQILRGKSIDNEKADLAGKESFPASDPPGFVSKSSEDHKEHLH